MGTPNSVSSIDPGQNFRGNTGLERRVRLQQTGDVRQIFLALAGHDESPCGHYIRTHRFRKRCATERAHVSSVGPLRWHVCANSVVTLAIKLPVPAAAGTF